MKKLILVCFIFILSACGGTNKSVIEDDRCVPVSSWICRFIDYDAGVVCYKYTTYGISCLPITQTNFSQ